MLGSETVAQERIFLFSVTTHDQPTTSLRIETSVGERAFDVSSAGRFEQRIGVQGTLGNRLTYIAGVGISPDHAATRTSQRAEMLLRIFDPSRQAFSLSAGGGVRHESTDINVAVGRFALGRGVGASRFQGNLVLEKAFSPHRDSVDLITSVGWSVPISRSFNLGIEGIGEDLEGFWTPDEAEGGARLLAGPSFNVAPVGARWQFSIGGGPVFHATRSTAVLAVDRGRFALRTMLSYSF